MNATEKLDSLKGSLTLKIVRCDSEQTVKIENLIVTTGRANLAKLLGGNAGMHVTHIGIGTGQTEAVPSDTVLMGGVLTPISQARIGVDLEAENGELFNDSRIVQFHFRIGKNIAVGMEIREYGLMCADGTLFSRIVRPSGFVKTDIDMIVGFWQIQF